jgi:AsmA protein
MKTPVMATTLNNNSAAAPAIAQKTSSPSASDTVSRFSLDSQIHVQHLLYNNLSLDNIKGQLHYSKNTVTLDPLAVTVLQGLYQGKLIWTKTHSIQIVGTLSHLNLALLQQTLGKKPSVTGLLDAKGSLSTEGQNQPQRLSHLNGQVFAVITQGSWTHLNVTNILSFLNAASNRQIVSDGNEFSSASGTFNIHNGITNNPDLKFTSALLTAKGSGSLDLIAHTLNYKIVLHPNAALLQQINALSQWIEQDIPLTVKGSWTNPKIKVQHGALLKKKVEEQLGDTLNTVRHLIIIR